LLKGQCITEEKISMRNLEGNNKVGSVLRRDTHTYFFSPPKEDKIMVIKTDGPQKEVFFIQVKARLETRNLNGGIRQSETTRKTARGFCFFRMSRKAIADLKAK